MPLPTPTAHDNPEAYIAGDRRRALAAGRELPDRVHGAALFADISGFTPLTEALVAELGAQRGAEELSAILDRLFDELLAHLHTHGGSVVYFSGDAVTCWLDGDDGVLATSCALAMQQAMASAGLVTLPSGRSVRLAMKVAVAVGAARRFVVGDPLVQLVDVLAGRLMDDLAEAEHQARAGEVVLDESAVRALGDRVTGPRRHSAGREHLVVERLSEPALLPTPHQRIAPLPEAVVRQWLLPAVYERLRTGRGEFLAELRTAVPLFLRFGGIDFDTDPQAQVKLDAFVVAAQRIIDGYGGSTLQLTIGDKGAYLYAVFGTPLAHEDDSARACAAALELLTLESEHAVTDLQIGLARGRVRSGTYGHAMRRTFCCLGDPVNLAARLMGAAPAGMVYAAASVREATGRSFRWDRLDDLVLKGKSGAIAAYALVAADRQTADSRHRRHSLPMIGRDDELAVLDRHIHQAGDGRGGIVAVTAGAGLGKSRLLVEGARLLTERGVLAYEGEAPAFGTRASYGAWQEIWTGALDVPAHGSPEQQVQHLADRVAALDPSLAPRVPLLGAVLDLPIPESELTASLSAKLRKASLEDLLAQLLRRLSGDGRSRAFLLEDAQWLDPLSIDLLQVLAQAATDLPVLFLIAQRAAAEPRHDRRAAGAAAVRRGHPGGTRRRGLRRDRGRQARPARRPAPRKRRRRRAAGVADHGDPARRRQPVLPGGVAHLHPRSRHRSGRHGRARPAGPARQPAQPGAQPDRHPQRRAAPRRQGRQRARPQLRDPDAARGLSRARLGAGGGPRPGRAPPDRADHAGAGCRRGTGDAPVQARDHRAGGLRGDPARPARDAARERRSLRGGGDALRAAPGPAGLPLRAQRQRREEAGVSGQGRRPGPRRLRERRGHRLLHPSRPAGARGRANDAAVAPRLGAPADRTLV